MGYNGWSNYETWCVGLWLDNDQGTHEMVRDFVNDCDAIHELMDMLKAFVEEGKPVLGASLYEDMLQASIDSVNWHELASHYWDDYKQEEGEEDDDDSVSTAG